jgi:hypothetical protein
MITIASITNKKGINGNTRLTIKANGMVKIKNNKNRRKVNKKNRKKKRKRRPRDVKGDQGELLEHNQYFEEDDEVMIILFNTIFKFI